MVLSHCRDDCVIIIDCVDKLLDNDGRTQPGLTAARADCTSGPLSYMARLGACAHCQELTGG